MRWFTPWEKDGIVEDFLLPSSLSSVTGQKFAPFGDGAIVTDFGSFGTEICEELFTPYSPHINLSLNGIEIFTNVL